MKRNHLLSIAAALAVAMPGTGSVDPAMSLGRDAFGFSGGRVKAKPTKKRQPPAKFLDAYEARYIHVLTSYVTEKNRARLAQRRKT